MKDFVCRRLNTAWYEYIKTVTNFRVYDPRNVEYKKLARHLQYSKIMEASMTIKMNFFFFHSVI